jgi:hypothetical protein
LGDDDKRSAEVDSVHYSGRDEDVRHKPGEAWNGGVVVSEDLEERDAWRVVYWVVEEGIAMGSHNRVAEVDDRGRMAWVVVP